MHYHSDRREKHHFRCWLHFGERGRCARFAVDWWSHFCFAEFAWDDDHGWGFSLALPPFAVWASVDLPWRLKERRAINLRIHGGALWWHFWVNDNEWHSKTPKWRDGNFNAVDFLLGRQKCETQILEERAVSVPMPECAYDATAKLVLYTWRRPRWFAKQIKRVEIEIPQGIPHEGKGENSWDCGDDATFGLTTGECNSIPEGVGVLVGSVLRSRVKHGGWKDWSWQREAAQ